MAPFGNKFPNTTSGPTGVNFWAEPRQCLTRGSKCVMAIFDAGLREEPGRRL